MLPGKGIAACHRLLIGILLIWNLVTALQEHRVRSRQRATYLVGMARAVASIEGGVWNRCDGRGAGPKVTKIRDRQHRAQLTRWILNCPSFYANQRVVSEHHRASSPRHIYEVEFTRSQGAAPDPFTRTTSARPRERTVSRSLVSI